MQDRLFSSLNLLLDNVEGTNLLLEYFSEFGKRLHAARDFNSVLIGLKDELKKIYVKQKIEIILWQNGERLIKFEFGSNKDKVTPSEEDIGETTLYSYILEKRQTILTNSYAPFCENINVETADLPAHSWLGVPMIVQDKVLGALVIWDDNPEHYFRLQDKQFLSIVTDMVSAALENIYLFNYVSENNGSLKDIETITPDDISKDPIKNLMCQLIELISKQADVSYAGVFIERSQQNNWRLVEEIYSNKSLSAIGIELIKCFPNITPELLEKEYLHWPKNQSVDEVGKMLWKSIDNFPVVSVLLLPFKMDGSTPGFLVISFSNDVKSVPEKIPFFRFILSLVALLLEKKLLQEKKNQYQNQIKHLEKIKAAGELASGAVHHLNNILSVILGKAQMIQTKLDGSSSERDMELLIKAAKDGANSIQRLQQTMSQNKLAIEQIPLSINNLIQEIVEIIRPRYKREAESKGIEYKLELSLGNVSPVMGDSAALREVILNLINNALDSMPNGGKLSIQTIQKDEKVLIFISDTGTGIPENIQNKIFEPFYTTKGEKGNGLGLSIAANLIKQHKGRIYVDSIVNKGSIFMIELPTTQNRISPETSPDKKSAGVNYKVLLIDDEGIVRETFAELLEEKGCEVTTASNAQEALLKFRKYECDLIFTDLNMPGTNGLDLAKEIKNIDPHVPVFIITGWNYFSHNKIETNGIIDGVIQKPFNMEKIMLEIKRVKSTLSK
jgi:signal transduction histidine kinase/ActR/RegA family two-component response regulator